MHAAVEADDDFIFDHSSSFTVLNPASRDLLSKCVKCLLVPHLCVVPVFMYVY